MKNRKYKYLIHLQPEPEGGFTVTVPALPGAVTYGETYEQALEMAQECIEVYLKTLIQLGKPVPPEPEVVPFETLVAR